MCFLRPSTSSKRCIVQHTQSVSVPVRHPSDKESFVSSQASRQMCIYRKYKIPGTYIRGILMCVASMGCFPGAWRRGSWHFQVASFHLQTRMDLLFVRFTLCFLLEQASREVYAARGAKRLECTCLHDRTYVASVCLRHDRQNEGAKSDRNVP